MNHNRDANVPIYLAPALLRLSFPSREGNTASSLFRPFPISRIRFRFVDLWIPTSIKEDRYGEVRGTWSFTDKFQGRNGRS